MKYRLFTPTIGLIALGLIGFSLSTTIAATPPTPPPPVTTPVTVHFPRMPISGYNFSYTYNVNRTTTNSRPEIGALQKLINGPTASEVSSLNLQAVVPATLGTCAGQPLPAGAVNAGKFMYKRVITGTDVAYKIRFCQSFPIAGVGTEALLGNAITATLWANITAVPGVNNISNIDIAYANNACIGGSGNTCWP